MHLKQICTHVQFIFEAAATVVLVRVKEKSECMQYVCVGQEVNSFPTVQ